MKKVASLLLIIAVISNLSSTVFASEILDLSRNGSITLEMNYDGEAVIGGEFVCVRVADAIYDDGNCVFKDILNGEIYQNTIPQISRVTELYLSNKSFFEEYSYISENLDGTVVFEDMKPALYFIYQKTESPGYTLISPFLVTVPYRGEFDVIANVKSALTPELEPSSTTSATTEPTHPSKLPQTGQLTWPIPIMAVSGIMLFSLGWILCFGRRKDNNA